MLHVLYLVHDLADPAVRRRVLMLLTGGATVTLAGFRRDDNPLAGIEGIQPIELGRTRDRRFLQRTLAVLRATFRLRRMVAGLKRQPDVIIARNLEMLTLAERAAGLMARRPPIAYEALDIHRLLLRRDPLGALLRAVERRLGRNARLLITSSPAFLRAYFARFAQISAPVELVENKVLALTEEAPLPVEGSRRAGPPWVIGWFGALRCRRSLALLAAFSRAMGGRFRIVLRGRPAHGEFEDFDGLVAREPFIEFLGPYRNPEDLAAIYRGVHFVWTIDFFEEHANSQWLLPNRLYEGCAAGAVPIAMANSESGRLLAGRGIGLLLEAAEEKPLEALVGDIDGERYRALANAVARRDRREWICGPEDCLRLVDRLKSLTLPGASPVLQQAA